MACLVKRGAAGLEIRENETGEVGVDLDETVSSLLKDEGSSPVDKEVADFPAVAGAGEDKSVGRRFDELLEL